MRLLSAFRALLLAVCACVLVGCLNSDSGGSESEAQIASIVVDFPPESSNLAPIVFENGRENKNLRVKGRLNEVVSGDRDLSDVVSFVIRATNIGAEEAISSDIQWQADSRGYWFVDIELQTDLQGNIFPDQQFELEVRWSNGEILSTDYQFSQRTSLTSLSKVIYWPQQDAYFAWDSTHRAIFLLSGESEERLVYQFEPIGSDEPLSVSIRWALDESAQKLYWLQSYSGQSQLKEMNLSDFSVRDFDALPAHLSFENNSTEQVECDGLVFSINCRLVQDNNEIQIIPEQPELSASMPYIFRSIQEVTENYILFTDFHNLYRFNLTSGEPEVVWHSRYFPYQDIANWFYYQGQQHLTIKELNGDWSLFRFNADNQLIKVHTFASDIASDIQYAGSEVNSDGLSYIMKSDSGNCHLVMIDYIGNSKESRSTSPCLLGFYTFTVESDVFFGMSVFKNAGFYYLNSIQESVRDGPEAYRAPTSGDSIHWELWQSNGLAFDAGATGVAVKRRGGISIFNPNGDINSFNFVDLNNEPDPLDSLINLELIRLPVIDQENSEAREMLRRELVGGLYYELFNAFEDSLMNYNWSNQQTALASRVEPGIAGYAYHYLNENKHGLWLGLGERGVFIEDKDSGRQALLSLSFE